MKKVAIVLIILATFVFSLYAEDLIDDKGNYSWRDEPFVGNITIPLIFARYSDDKYDDIVMEINSDTPFDNGTNTKPLMFTYKGQSIEEYIASPESGGSLSFYDLAEEGLEAYFYDMTQGRLNIDFIPLKNPQDPAKGLWDIGYEAEGGSVPIKIIETVNEYYFDQTGEPNYLFLHYSDIVVLPISKDFYSGNGTGGTYLDNPEHRYSIVVFGQDINNTLTAIAHELGHQLMTIMDTGPGYYGFTNDDEALGLCTSRTSVYDLMSKGNPSTCPYIDYGIKPFNTWQLIHQNYLDSADFVFATEADHNIYFDKNKFRQKVKHSRAILTEEDRASGVKNGIILSIALDKINELDNVGYEYNKMVEEQQFFIELRNGKGFDEISSYDKSGDGIVTKGQCKGIQISHIMNCEFTELNYAGTQSKPYRMYHPHLDVECATPLPVSEPGDYYYRDPNWNFPRWDDDIEQWVQVPENIGMFYNGKEVNDWIDDWGNGYDIEGGYSAWWRDPLHSEVDRTGSLPGDFFNDTDRNKFTPTTRPNTNSWKLKETHLAVYINNIDPTYDYADITVYRNYWSIPITEEYMQINYDSKTTLTIPDYCYFGEDFTVDPGFQLIIGNGSDFMKATLVPETNMIMKENSTLMFTSNTALRLEESSLTFAADSKYQPYDLVNIELINSDLIFEEGVLVDLMGEITSYNITVDGFSSLSYPDLNLKGNSLLSLNGNSQLIINAGTNIAIPANAYLVLADGSELIIDEGANLIFEPGSQIIVEGNAKITGNIQDSYASVIVTDGSTLTVGDNSSFSFKYNGNNSLELGLNSEFIVGNGSEVYFNPTTPTVCADGSQITIKENGYLRAYETSFTGTGLWDGIVSEVGSSISTFSASISNADWGINAQAADVSLTNTSFSDCENGVWLLNCSNFYLIDNGFDGKGTGTGIRATESNGDIVSNTVLNHGAGIVAVSCSPLISENYLYDNATCGIALSGYNTYPQLVNPSSVNDVLNNRIINNGLITDGENGSQIYIMYRANAYLNNGCNNIYSGNENILPSVPCVKTVSDMTVNDQKALLPVNITIPAEYNYWGINEIAEGDYSSFFDMWREPNGLKSYSIDYNPYAIDAYEAGAPQPPMYSTNEPPTQEEQLLKVAMMLESNEIYTASIKKYEKIIEKYPDTPEYYIASSRLPQVLAKEEESLDPVLKTFDEALVSDKITNKKFIKQMKVSTNIKSKKYDKAISLAQELKSEAESDMERNLCDIEIAICNLMKNSQNKSDGNRMRTLASLDGMLDELIPEGKSQSLDISEPVVLPETSQLYQNYPNPFNPTTEIKYALIEPGNVNITVYNMNGEVVSNLVNTSQNPGEYTASFDASHISSGVFYYTLEVNSKLVDSKKMVLVR